MANDTRGRTLGDVLVEHWIWPAYFAVIGLGAIFATSWEGGFPGWWRDVVADKPQAVIVLWVTAIMLVVATVAAALHHQRRRGREEGEETGSKAAETAHAAALKRAETQHAGNLKRVTDEHEAQAKLMRAFYGNNISCRVHVIARNGLVGSEWQELGVLRAHFEITLTNSAVWPQWIEVESIHFWARQGGEWFKTRCLDGLKKVDPGGDLQPPIQARATDDDIRQIMSRPELAGLCKGCDRVLIFGTLVVRVRAVFDALELAEARPVLVPTALWIGHSERDAATWRAKLST